MNQPPLFQLGHNAVEAVSEPCPEVETDRGMLSRMGDKRRIRRLSTVADQLQGATDPLERAKLATQARDLAQAILEETILDANRGGITWRELGAALGVPFQTLYRRYGSTS